VSSSYSFGASLAWSVESIVAVRENEQVLAILYPQVCEVFLSLLSALPSSRRVGLTQDANAAGFQVNLMQEGCTFSSSNLPLIVNCSQRRQTIVISDEERVSESE
jgi:hypothetical protein